MREVLSLLAGVLAVQIVALAFIGLFTVIDGGW